MTGRLISKWHVGVALACIVLMVTGFVATADGQTLSLSVATNAPTVLPGDTTVVSIVVSNPGLPSTVDFYFGVLLPDADTIVFFRDLTFNSGTGSLTNPATLRPIVPGVNLAAPFTFNQPTFFTYRWTGTEPEGVYTLFLAAVLPGALADNRVDPGDIVALGVGGLSFLPDIRGTYQGSGSETLTNCQDSSENGTYGFTGSVSITNQTGATFSGTAIWTATVGGFVLRTTASLTGTVTTAGDLSGSFTYQFTVNGVFDSSGDGTFTGRVTGATLTVNFSGQDRVGDTCVFTGSFSGTR